jgi:peptide/nickel transport system substrate-binding protein
LERSLSLRPFLVELMFTAIDGATTCGKRPPACDLSESIVVDDESVTFHLTHPDPDLPFKLALPAAFPVPVEIPVENQGLDPVPATGPYMIAEASGDGLELVRNPEFREWSAAAQPDGFVDAISWGYGEDVSRAFDRLRAGELDWMTDTPDPDDLASVVASQPDQVVEQAFPATWHVAFDVRVPPFDDVRVRQALNYAIDREHVVELLGGAASHRVTCQILPPNLQGYEPFCPYTLEPQAGVWSAPDLDRASELIEEAGALGERVSVMVADARPNTVGSIDAMRYVAEVLDDLGLRAELNVVPYRGYFSRIYSERSVTNAFFSGWVATYAGAGGFIDVDFRCGRPDNAAGTCTEVLERRVAEAQRLQATDPAAAHRAWVEIEHDLVEDAVWLPLANPIQAHVFSDRTENVQVHAVWGILLSRLWVR